MESNKKCKESSKHPVQQHIHKKGYDCAGEERGPSSPQRIEKKEGQVANQERRAKMDNQEGQGDKYKEKCSDSDRGSNTRSRSGSPGRSPQSPQSHPSSVTGVTDGRPDGQSGQGGASLNTNNSNNKPDVQSVNNNSSFHCTKFGLTCLSTNADNLRNKLAELNHVISLHNPDIIAVQEVFPKNSKVAPDKVTYEINGYELFLGDNTEKRGVALYIKDDIKANEGQETHVQLFPIC